jgi:hypothetical protein
MGQRLSGKGGKDESLVSLSIGGKRNEVCVCGSPRMFSVRNPFRDYDPDLGACCDEHTA